MTISDVLLDNHIRVFEAVRNDVPWIMEQLRRLDDFLPMQSSLFPSDDNLARTMIHAVMDNHFFAIAKRGSLDPKPIGLMAGFLAPHPLNPELIFFSELFWWVLPEERGSMVSVHLFREFMAFGRSHADAIVMSLQPNTAIHESSLLTRGFKPLDRTYILEVNRG